MSNERATGLSRRELIKGLGAATLPIGSVLGCGSESGSTGGPREYWLSAQGDEEATYGLVASADPFDRALTAYLARRSNK